MPEHRVIRLAATGTVPRERDDPAPPVTAGEQLDCAHKAAA